jgi:hypothetical protein
MPGRDPRLRVCRLHHSSHRGHSALQLLDKHECQLSSLT